MGIAKDSIDTANKLAEVKYQYFKKYWYIFVIVFILIITSYILMYLQK